MVRSAEKHEYDDGLDIVFLGDSIMERWNGTMNMGTQTLKDSFQYKRAFEKRFTKRGGGQLDGLVFGTEGDTVSWVW